MFNSYCTPDQFALHLGINEVAGLLSDENLEVQPALLRFMLDKIAGGETVVFPSDFTDQERVDFLRGWERLRSVLQEVSRFMDGYLAQAVQLPIAFEVYQNTPVVECCRDLARCSLAYDCDNLTELMEKRCDRWRLWLRDVASKKVLPFGNQAVQEGVSTTGKPRYGAIGGSGCDFNRFTQSGCCDGNNPHWRGIP